MLSSAVGSKPSRLAGRQLIHDLPPLDSLRGFEAAARHLSLTRAATELSVTPGAVSKQVKALEDQIGRPLFLHVPVGIAPLHAVLAGEPPEAVAAAGDLPVTMKMRKGIDDDHLTYLEAGRAAAEEGIGELYICSLSCRSV